ncbi:uncharacterized protein LOC111203311 [Brassica napus]|uniref:uncharacterized protein LOC111203311 n=1 Tax=Brassica napus TaxID=3708 RepID=UPI002078A1DE|nr:uncharacterized protein LOC111203311 [Brassica napus]
MYTFFPTTSIFFKIKKEKEREREKEREKKKKKGESSPELVAGATTRQTVELATTIIRNQSPSSCSSRRDEAVDTKHASNEARTKPYAPPENRPSRARETHAPPPEIVAAAAPPSPPANFPIWSLFEQLEFIDNTFLLLR